MNNFSFCNSTQIEFGVDKERNVGEYIKNMILKKCIWFTLQRT